MFLTIQCYRGLAAIAVAAFHLSIRLGEPSHLGHPILAWLTWRMDLGVDFFFVLSGFIILRAHEGDIGRPSRVLRFCAKRFVRIYPTYWVYVATFTLLVALGFGTAAKTPDTPAAWISTFALVRLENFLTPISPAWTLFHEVGFYAVFATLILNRTFGIAVLVGWQVTCLVLLQFPGPEERTPFAVYFAAFNVDFVIGMLAYHLFARGKAGRAWLWLAAGMGLLAVTLAAEANGVAPTGTPLVYAAAFGAVILGSVTWEAGSPRPWIPLLPFLGEASYSIYLTHTAFEGLFSKIVLRANTILHASDTVVYAAILVATVAAGCAAYRLVERPVLARSRRWLDGPGLRPGPMAASTAS